MKHLFPPTEEIVVPDGTRLYEVIGPRILSEAKLPVNDGVSVAIGELPNDIVSRVHVHPIVYHFTWVIEGRLTVMMKDSRGSGPYRLHVPVNKGVLTEPGTFFQLINDSGANCKVFYIVGPAFVFEVDDKGNVVYNDAVVLPYDWKKLEELNWKPPELGDIDSIKKARDASLKRLSSHCP